MSARVQSESARRVSDCVTALLREQPFFGSLALRLPIRADASCATVATVHRPITRTAQGGVISPMLSNIFLHDVRCLATPYPLSQNGRECPQFRRYREIVCGLYGVANCVDGEAEFALCV